MLDIQTYRMCESLAKSELPTWRIAQRHTLDLFEKGGFPVRLGALSELRQLIDTMHENRFEGFVQELGGLNDEEIAALAGAAREVTDFQWLHFPAQAPIVPLSTLVAMLASFLKLRALKPGFASLLEIGPGCGYLSLFLRRLHPALRNYSLIEACESFYLLQHHLNAFSWGSAFEQRIHARRGAHARFYATASQSAEQPEILSASALPQPERKVFQYPWWRIGDLAASAERFDVVVSNANLAEFMPEALHDYLTLVQDKLADDGILFVQCFGSQRERGLPFVLQALANHGLAPAFLAIAGRPKSAGMGLNRPVIEPQRDDTRKFLLDNAVFVGRRHPLFQACYRPESYHDGFAVEFGGLREAYFPERRGRRLCSKEDVFACMSS